MAGPGPARRALPYGSWPTPFTPAAVASGGGRPASVALDGDDVWWAEERPDEQGRTALLRWRDGVVTEPLPAGADVGTRVHEYGGGAWWVRAGTVWWVERADQRLRRMRPGEAPVPLTPPADARGAGPLGRRRRAPARRPPHRGTRAPPRGRWSLRRTQRARAAPRRRPTGGAPQRAGLRRRPALVAGRPAARLAGVGPPGHAVGRHPAARPGGRRHDSSRGRR